MKLSQKLMRTGWRALTRPRRISEPPLHAQIEPTNFCNYDCLMCCHKDVVKKPEHMPLEKFTEIIDGLRPGYVTLSGYGEPLMHPQLFDMIGLLTQRGISTNITTNGSLLRNHFDDILASGLELVSVSLDAADPETYMRVRRKDDFERILTDMRELAQRRGDSRLPHMRASFVIQKDNLDRMIPFLRLMRDAGMDSVLFQPYLEVGREAGEESRAAVGIDKEQLLRELEAADVEGKSLKISTNARFLISRLDDYFKVQYLREPDPKILRRCIKPWISVYISVDGEARPCCSFAAIPLGTGNVFDKDIVKILNDEDMRTFREKLTRGVAPHWLCARCMPLGFWETVSSSSW